MIKIVSAMLDVLLKQPEVTNDSKAVIRISDRTDKPIKSAMKAVSWRVVGTIDTILISYFITGKVTVALSIGSVEVITKTVLYFFHERLWARIHRIKFKIWTKSDGKKYHVEGVK